MIGTACVVLSWLGPFSPLGLVSLPCASADAAVGLTTVPVRERTVLTIYNPVDLTLVQEYRTLVLKPGLNRIQYQWTGTLIDSTSLELRAKLPADAPADAVTLAGIVYPVGTVSTLVWELDCPAGGEIPFEISYFTSGLSWSAGYVLRASSDESTATVDGSIAIRNASGEDYPKAEVRVVCGEIHLTEGIATLAFKQATDRQRAIDEAHAREELLREAALAECELGGEGAFMMMSGGPGGSGMYGSRAGGSKRKADVAAARMADYHIFTISDTQAVMDGETSRFAAIATKTPMPLEVLYRVRLGHDEAEKCYRFINDAAHHLPNDGPLPNGLWQVFRATAGAELHLSYAGVVDAPYAPPGQTVELTLGIDPAIAVRQVHQWHGESDHCYGPHGHVVSAVRHDAWTCRVVNTSTIPVSLEYLVDAPVGLWTVWDLPGERRDATTWRVQASVPAGRAINLGPFTITSLHGDYDAARVLPRPPVATALPAPVCLPAPAVAPEPVTWP